jgi:hypothetical protein
MGYVVAWENKDKDGEKKIFQNSQVEAYIRIKGNENRNKRW